MGSSLLPQLNADSRPLRSLFLDLNAYFASCEQAQEPSLRNKPIAVCPVMADTSFIIAASYEAKKYGIKTGTQIGEAKRLCPGLLCVPGRHSLYTHYHKQIIDAVDSVLPVQQVCSIDEMKCALIGDERDPVRVRVLAKKIKAAIADNVSPQLTCSVGVAPNAFLAKLATDLMKPDGLVVIESKDLPHRLRGLSLREFCGINRRTEARLQAAGLFISDDLLDASIGDLTRAFRSRVIAERWFYMLRGYEVELKLKQNQSLGHSHILPPDLRSPQGTRDVLLRLVTKATARLRSTGLWTSSITVYVAGRPSWTATGRCAPTQDSLTITSRVLELWESRNFDRPMQVGITFHDLAPAELVTPSLFEDTAMLSKLSHGVDRVNQKFGKNKIHLASIHSVQDAAPERIAFQKVDLFSEGKDDNEWHPPAEHRKPPIFRMG